MTTPTITAAEGPRPGRRVPGAWTVGLHRGVLEIRWFFREWEQVLFTFLMPAFLLVLFSLIFDGFADADVDRAQWYVATIMAMALMSVSFQSLGIAIAIERDNGVLRRLRGTPMPKAAYFLGKLWLVLATALVQVAVLLGMGVASYGLELPASAAEWWTLLWVAVLGLTACGLLGIAVSSVPRSGRAAQAVVVFPFLGLQFVSGVYLPPSMLPDSVNILAAVFPLKWMAEGLRGVFLPEEAAALEYAGVWAYDQIALVLLIWCVAGFVLCLTTFRWKGKNDG
ncbi:ABC-2 type transport system permease protein [Nocardiopsis mwathae]|uniref:Transport permease protein n=1 Tax=Nocardiopsis mwathae TaxID=1472723 RepID=A0A7W9YL83_9ACTN|nr:ABC transporter permease [Nocardiopsis mwathae]MBB6174045.1 ABC-2 type transport system permease protein [Nocardiopsis mwathae]